MSNICHNPIDCMCTDVNKVNSVICFKYSMMSIENNVPTKSHAYACCFPYIKCLLGCINTREFGYFHFHCQDFHSGFHKCSMKSNTLTQTWQGIIVNIYHRHIRKYQTQFDKTTDYITQKWE